MAGATGVAAPKEKPKRIDPKRRSLDGFGPWVVKNKRAGFRYGLIYKANADMGVEYFASMGWEPVKDQGADDHGNPKGEYLAGGRTTQRNGQVIEYRGHVLMRISEELWDELNLFGIDGNTGQAGSDYWEKRLRGGRGVDKDPLKGLNLMGREGPYVRLEELSDKDDQDG